MTDRIETGMSTEVFLSREIDGFIETIVYQHHELFSIAMDINRAGVKCFLEMEIPKDGTSTHAPNVIANRIFARALTNFEAAIILLQRGMAIEGGLLARSVFEAAFWICFFAAKPEAAREALQVDSLRSELSSLESLINYNPKEDRSPEHARIAEIRRELKRRKRPSAEEIAKDGEIGPAYLFYLDLCARAAHTSATSTDYYLEAIDSKEAQHTIGPDADGVAFFLFMSCQAMVTALTGMASVMKQKSTYEYVAEIQHRWLKISEEA